MANKYRDVVDGDELLVDAINFVDNGRYDYDSYNGQYDDPREFICAYFAHPVQSTPYGKNSQEVQSLSEKRQDNDVVLIGSKDLMHFADRIFLQQEGALLDKDSTTKKNAKRK